ncbi:NAD(P)-binding protein [Methylobacterium sp. WL122]|nr:NAD(P)-binding protein [Methylobacterium sp. WL122]
MLECSQSRAVLVVGAGFAGAVHARLLAEAGYEVKLIDRRRHLGGNAYDAIDGNGVRVHRYGPHLFHSKMKHVVDWLMQFDRFVSYSHRVRALLPSGAYVPLPINRSTISAIYDRHFETSEAAETFLKSVAAPIEMPSNAAEYLYSRIGVPLTNLFFRPYTKKMWDVELEAMAPNVVARIPIRFDDNDSYFRPGETQILPIAGYTRLFERMLDHPGIAINLGVKFSKGMEQEFYCCFNSMSIDEYYDYCEGYLPYRSIRFHHSDSLDCVPRAWSVTNFTDDSPFTRETAWHVLPGHVVADTGRRTLTREEPCDFRDNADERFYPVMDSGGHNLQMYETYKAMAAENRHIKFIGRCGTYRYLDMDQVINQSLIHVRDWIRSDSRQR